MIFIELFSEKLDTRINQRELLWLLMLYIPSKKKNSNMFYNVEMHFVN